MQITLLWLILRILTSMIAGFVSTIRPLTTIEESIPLLPPGSPLMDWLERAFLSPWLRWDAIWYQTIATQGYNPTDGTTAFHPLYPFLASVLIKIGFHPLFSLLFISSVAGIALFFIFFRLLRLDLEEKEAFFGLILFSLAPLSFIFFAPYTEALFLLFAVSCIYLARQKSWWLAGVAGCLAAFTRQQGIFLLIPLAWELFENSGRKSIAFMKNWKSWLSLLMIPLGLVIFSVYRIFFVRDLPIYITSIKDFIFTALISQGATQVVPVQSFVWPWQLIYLSIKTLITSHSVEIGVNIIYGFIFIVILILTWTKMRLSYRIYSLVITLVSFSFYGGPIHVNISLPRHLFLAFPVFIGLPLLVKQPWMRILSISLSGIGMSFLLTLYVLSAWVP